MLKITFIMIFYIFIVILLIIFFFLTTKLLVGKESSTNINHLKNKCINLEQNI